MGEVDFTTAYQGSLGLEDRKLGPTLLNYLQLSQAVRGSEMPEEAIMQDLLQFWPRGRMTVRCLLNAAAAAAGG